MSHLLVTTLLAGFETLRYVLCSELPWSTPCYRRCHSVCLSVCLYCLYLWM